MENKEEKATLRKHLHGYGDEQFEEEVNRFPLNECVNAMVDHAKQKQAEFIKLIEGEIAYLKDVIEIYDQDEDKIRLQTLTDLLQKL